MEGHRLTGPGVCHDAGKHTLYVPYCGSCQALFCQQHGQKGICKENAGPVNPDLCHIASKSLSVRAEQVIWRKLDEVSYLCKLIRYSLQISFSFNQLPTGRRQLLSLNGEDKQETKDDSIEHQIKYGMEGGSKR